MSENNTNSFVLNATTPLTICNLIHDSKSSNSGGFFDTSSKIIKSVDDL